MREKSGKKELYIIGGRRGNTSKHIIGIIWDERKFCEVRLQVLGIRWR